MWFVLYRRQVSVIHRISWEGNTCFIQLWVFQTPAPLAAFQADSLQQETTIQEGIAASEVLKVDPSDPSWISPADFVELETQKTVNRGLLFAMDLEQKNNMKEPCFLNLSWNRRPWGLFWTMRVWQRSSATWTALGPMSCLVAFVSLFCQLCQAASLCAEVWDCALFKNQSQWLHDHLHPWCHPLLQWRAGLPGREEKLRGSTRPVSCTGLGRLAARSRHVQARSMHPRSFVDVQVVLVTYLSMENLISLKLSRRKIIEIPFFKKYQPGTQLTEKPFAHVCLAAEAQALIIDGNPRRWKLFSVWKSAMRAWLRVVLKTFRAKDGSSHGTDTSVLLLENAESS